MLLALDVGNTNITAGIYNQDKLEIFWRLSTDRQRTEDEYAILLMELLERSHLCKEDITAVIIASVVPPLSFTLGKMSQKYFGTIPLEVGPGIKTGLNIRMENPREVGADRIVNAVAAFSLYGGPLIIVDFGTATTFDVISEKGDYLGGAIAPGIGISTEALFEKAAKLPRVELIPPKSVIGRSTVTSMQSGIIFGFAGQVDGIVNRMASEFLKRPRVVATGGLASLLAKHSDTIELVNPLLTLEGLKLVYWKNCGENIEVGRENRS